MINLYCADLYICVIARRYSDEAIPDADRQGVLGR
jgi:hypothetical protein